MLALTSFLSSSSVLLVLVPVLFVVAWMTLLESKVLASLQRSVGPDTVFVFGVLQPFADALKLLVKEMVIPNEAQSVLFMIAPALTLISALLGWSIMPFNLGMVLANLNLGWLFYLAISSLGIYGMIFSGWASNSVYSLLGGMSSTAHMISYELVLSGSGLGVMLLSQTFNLSLIVESQSYVAHMFPLFPLFLLFLVSGLAELNRTPFDLVEAESELVSGFFTEYSSFLFTAFFLAEYSNIALLSALSALLWLKGSLIFTTPISLVFGFKTLLVMFSVVWVSGTLPRLRYDLLMSASWTMLLPVIFGLVTMVLSLYVWINTMW